MTLSRALQKTEEFLLLAFLTFSILWRGGKSLDATWGLALVSVFLVFSWLLRSMIDRKDPDDLRLLPSPAGLILLATFFGWTLASYVRSKTGNVGFDEVLREGSLLLIALWVSGNPWKEDERLGFFRRVAKTIVIAALLACVLGGFIYTLQPVNRFVGSFFDYRFTTDYWPNAWAEFLLLAWPFLFIALPKNSYLRSALLGVLLGSLLLSYSRGGTLSLMAQVITGMMLAGVVLWPKRRSITGKMIGTVLIHGCAVLVVGSLLFWNMNSLRSQYHAVQSVTEKVTLTSSEGTSSIDERLQFMKQSFILSNEHTWFGFGPYSFRFVQPMLQEGVFATADHPHNVFLKLALERGWPSVILFVSILALAAYKGIRALWKHGDVAAGVLVVSLGGVMIHNLIDYNLQFVGIALPMMMSIAWLLGTTIQSSKTLYNKTIQNFALILGLIIITLTLVEGYYLWISSRGRRAEVRGDLNAALLWYKRADPELFSRDMLLGEAKILLDSGKKAEAGLVLDHYFSENQFDARAWILLGDIVRTEPKPTDEQWYIAKAAYERAVLLGHLNYLGASFGLAETLERTKDRKGLAERQAGFDSTFTAFQKAIMKNTHFIDLSSSPEQLQDFAQVLARVYPKDAERYTTLASEAYAHATQERGKFHSRRPGFLW